MTSFDPTALPAAFYDERIGSLQRREAELASELGQVRKQLDWWREGRSLFVEGSADRPGLPDGGKEKVETGGNQQNGSTEILPSTDFFVSSGTKPSLRQAIMRVMLDEPAQANGTETGWTVPAIVGALRARRWEPGGKNVDNMVRHMLGDMVKRGQLERPGYGAYALAPDVRPGIFHDKTEGRDA